MSDLFGCELSGIRRHIRNVFAQKEVPYTLAAKAMAECKVKGQRLAAAVPASELKTLEAGIARVTVENVKRAQWARWFTRCTLAEPYGCIRIAPQPHN